jgi:hypothetical protein
MYRLSGFKTATGKGLGERYKVLLYSNVIIFNKMVLVYKPDDKRFNPLDESLESLEEQLPR